MGKLLTFSAVSTRIEVQIQINDDDTVEVDEQFLVGLTLLEAMGTGVTLGLDMAGIQIKDNDGRKAFVYSIMLVFLSCVASL